MPKTPDFSTRSEALEYLATNANFMQLYQRNKPGRPLDDLGFAQAKRYASGMIRAARENREVRHLGELRGHVYTEHHREGRRLGARKPGYENYEPPKPRRRGWYEQMDSKGNYVAVVRLTDGQGEAERAISRATRPNTLGRRGRAQKRTLTPWRIAINVYGPGDARAMLFWKGGWYADNLMRAIGYTRTRRGYWVRTRNAPRLEKWLLDYMHSLPHHAYGERWSSILRYEIYMYPDPVREIATEEGLDYVAPQLPARE